MAATLAEANVRIEGTTAIVDLSGDINRLAEPVLAGAYDEAGRAGATNVILNFAGTEFINSTGIAVIVGILARARAENRAVSACGLTEHYQHIFQITRLADFMPMFPDESAARANAS
ncbi:MAG TPA: STAS domain-containing protein [Actinomycetota bacterium]|nr:STAS domain-containing protein [Actinomycetota bacterium]